MVRFKLHNPWARLGQSLPVEVPIEAILIVADGAYEVQDESTATLGRRVPRTPVRVFP